MEQNNLNEITQSQIQEENSFLPKQKIDWSFLSDIESLISKKIKVKKFDALFSIQKQQD